MDYENETISIITIKDIKVGEELFINYNAEVDQESPVWFEQH
jgi:SET domain-containing protein